MAVTPSNMLPLGTIAPDFTLFDTLSEKNISLQNYHSETATVIMFICNHCPFVKHIAPKLVELAQDYQLKGIQFIAISSNDAKNYPADAPDKMSEMAKQLKFTFPYCYDETQAVAKAYQAACTPDFYIFNKNFACVYRGQFDDSRPDNATPVTGKDIRAALDDLLLGNDVSPDQKPSIGCNIKWLLE